MVLDWHSLAQDCGQRQDFLLAFSGGLDSTVLLHLFYQLRKQHQITLRAAYVHHGLSPYADSWQRHCQQQCEQWQIPFIPLAVNIAGKSNLEAKARQARYQALFAQLINNETLVTAQHLDDQCETVLLALKRGSGPAGLAAMAAYQQDKHLWRPLLAYSRSEIEAYAQQQQLIWVEDESNQQDRFDRNFLRHHVLPLLAARWPHFTQACARSATLCADQEQLLDELLADELAQWVDSCGAISIEGLQQCSVVKRHALLRRWLNQFAVIMPSLEQLQTLWQEVALSQQDANPCFRLDRGQLRRYRQRLYFLPLYVRLEQTRLVWVTPFSPLALPDGLGQLSAFHLEEGQAQVEDRKIQVRLPADNEVVTVRFGLQGDIRCLGRQGSRKAKKIWQELSVPPWKRDRIPLLYYNDTLIAAVGYFITPAATQVDTPQKNWQIVWQ